jgi:plastocyanin
MTRKTSFFLGAFLIIACLVVLYNLRQPKPRTETANAEPVETPTIVAPPKKPVAKPAAPKPAPTPDTVAATSTSAPPATTPPAAQKGGTIKGQVVFKATAPGEKSVSMAADPACAALHSAAVTTRHFVVGTNGALANVFVSVKDGLAGKTFSPPKKAAVLDQQGCLYFPYVFGMQTGQDLEILNSDATLHNVHIFPNNNPETNKGMPVKGMKFTVKFANPEVDAPVQFKCDVHPWMFAYGFVLPHPFFASTGEDGSFELKGLPAGTYTIQAWHHKAGKLTQSVAIGENETEDISFEFSSPP